jgi:hypothetical protein
MHEKSKDSRGPKDDTFESPGCILFVGKLESLGAVEGLKIRGCTY